MENSNNPATIIPVILCGGAGSRLWPVSREAHPKFFIRLSDGHSLLQTAFLRGAGIPGVREIVTVTGKELQFETDSEFQQVNGGGVDVSYILEPFGRNTSAAIAAAALRIAQAHGEDAVMLVLAADHLITDVPAFYRAVESAVALAREERLVTFGIKPSHPETGYGYIEADGTTVRRFVEKPSQDVAESYLLSGNFFWNSGMFCFTARTILEEMRAYCPEILDTVAVCLGRSSAQEQGGRATLCLDAASFADVPDKSIDYTVMEKSRRVSVCPCDIGWSDVGSWSAIGDLIDADSHGNRVEGQALLHDVHNCHIKSAGRVVGAVGVSDLIIIDTPDALLVANRNKAQDVKHIYSELKAQGNETYKTHLTVKRPWGTVTLLEEGRHHKIKRLVVTPGSSLSLQMHHHRSEHWVVVQGRAQVTNGEHVHTIGENESTFIPAGQKHRLANPGLIDLVVIEVQSGAYLNEDDIIRFEDNYGRV